MRYKSEILLLLLLIKKKKSLKDFNYAHMMFQDSIPQCQENSVASGFAVSPAGDEPVLANTTGYLLLDRSLVS